MYSVSYILYYLKMLMAYGNYYQSYVFNTFRDYPPEVNIAAVIGNMAFVGIIVMSVATLVVRRRKHKERKVMDNLKKRFGDGITYVLSDESATNLTREEIAKALHLDNLGTGKQTPLKNKQEKWFFCRLVYFTRISDKMAKNHRANLTKMLNIFSLREFMETEVSQGIMMHKTQAMTMLRNFKMYVSPWAINKLLDSKSTRIHRLAMYLSMISNSDSDLDYFETDFFDNNCCIYDEIELGYVLQRLRKRNMKLPNLASLALKHKEPRTQCIFVRLMRRFGQLEYCNELENLYSRSKDKKLIEEISRTWGYLHYTEGEKLLADSLLMQPDDTKVAAMHALVRMATGQSIGVLRDCYHSSSNPHVRFEALRCMYNYGSVGRAAFDELERKADEDNKRFFDFFHNPITLGRIPLDKEQAYHPSVETVYNWGN